MVSTHPAHSPWTLISTSAGGSQNTEGTIRPGEGSRENHAPEVAAHGHAHGDRVGTGRGPESCSLCCWEPLSSTLLRPSGPRPLLLRSAQIFLSSSEDGEEGVAAPQPKP